MDVKKVLCVVIGHKNRHAFVDGVEVLRCPRCGKIRPLGDGSVAGKIGM